MAHTKARLLIVDDEPNFRESLELALEDRFEVQGVGSLREAAARLRTMQFDALLLDVNLPDGNGVELFRELRATKPAPLVIVMTAYATVDNAVQALKEGAAEYLVKPFDLERLKRELAVHLENRSLHCKVAALDRELSQIKPPFITSGSGGMQVIVERAEMIGPLNLPVLIVGETGTGKEKLAQWLHALAGVPGNMVAINCAALPKDIIESELFGHARGAFSGAVGQKEGLVEKANGGTLFLDEIGELSPAIQAKLLRVLEEGVYYKLGETRERQTTFRLISATNRDLLDPASEFRSDLYYRINGVTLELPPLRERRDDVLLLAAAFIKEANAAYGKAVRELSPKAVKFLLGYDWPGNIRELKWYVNRAVALAKGAIADPEPTAAVANGKPLLPEADDFSLPFNEAMDRLERAYLAHALAAAGNNKTEAARILCISVRALHYKLDKFGM